MADLDTRTAERIIGEWAAGTHPAAHGIIWAGSSLRQEATDASDIDLVVIERELATHSYRSLTRHDGVLVEALVHTPGTIHLHFGREVAGRRPGLLHMCATGAVMFAADGECQRIQDAARATLHAGPPPLDDDELRLRRYRITVQADDLATCADPCVSAILAADLTRDLVELMLLRAGRWGGTPKWLLSDLAGALPAMAHRVRSAHRRAAAGDPVELLALAEAELRRAGGRADDGYVHHSRLG
jgi:hypothetical protein